MNPLSYGPVTPRLRLAETCDGVRVGIFPVIRVTHLGPAMTCNLYQLSLTTTCCFRVDLSSIDDESHQNVNYGVWRHSVLLVRVIQSLRQQRCSKATTVCYVIAPLSTLYTTQLG